jgi:hypothetical protein
MRGYIASAIEAKTPDVDFSTFVERLKSLKSGIHSGINAIQLLGK